MLNNSSFDSDDDGNIVLGCLYYIFLGLGKLLIGAFFYPFYKKTHSFKQVCELTYIKVISAITGLFLFLITSYYVYILIKKIVKTLFGMLG